jgi:hypothetical protein
VFAAGSLEDDCRSSEIAEAEEYSTIEEVKHMEETSRYGG